MKYAICTTERTRGTLLCKLLESIKIAGRPSEWPVEIIKDWIDNKRFFIESTCNNVCGTKIRAGCISDIDRYINLNTYFDKYIYLRHPDIIWQSISLMRAVRINKFKDFKEHPNQLRSPVSERIHHLTVTHQEIYSTIQRFMRQKLKWELFFQENNIGPLVIWYHDLGTPEQQHQTLKKIMYFLGIYTPFEFKEEFSNLTFVQSDAWNEKVYEDFLLNFDENLSHEHRTTLPS